MTKEQIDQQRMTLLARKALLRDELDGIDKALLSLAGASQALAELSKATPEEPTNA